MGSIFETARLFRNASLSLLVAGTAAAALAPTEASAESGGSERPGTESQSTQPTDVHKATEQALRKVKLASATTSGPKKKPAASAPISVHKYTVRPGDTLSSIAQHQMGHWRNWELLYTANHRRPQADGGMLLDPDELQVGWVLHIPPVTERSGATRAAGTAHTATATHTATAKSTSPQTRHGQSAKTRPEEARAASRRTTSVGSAQAIAESIVPREQFGCFSEIISHESGWNVHAVNPSSGAYGLAQALPASKMASAGSDWRNNAATQVRWALKYMDSHYGSPCDAWNFWQDHSWY
ncbi:LysM peptidoglycan-binding domain-containing protein [Streptomyces sp. NPDC051172]|uniref:LysM peptidoglycan-binding domain-containing protein n=1 Tax=Streptomyces sp. NPDC051172 TaxID=3155796 RepID=UPI003414AA93